MTVDLDALQAQEPTDAVLVALLSNAAYRNGNIDAEDRWSDKKYREVGEATDVARLALIERLATIRAELAAAQQELPEAQIMRLWRQAGLPEYFLGNGGTNLHLCEFVRLCRAALAGQQMPREEKSGG